MGTGVSTQDGSARRAGARSACRLVGIALAGTIILGAVPGTASATPTRPSDAEISAAQQAKDAAEEQVGVLTAGLAAAQADQDAARAASAIARGSAPKIWIASGCSSSATRR